jgi:ribosomal protein L19E
LKNKESLKQRKAEGRYKPTKAEWAATIREHRRYKEQLKKKGDIK